MAGEDRGCAFCGAGGATVRLSVLDEKWCRPFGGDPVVALDHGWYRSAHNQHEPADRVDPTKFFEPQVHALCDYCVHGWVEDVRWRAEPALLSMAAGRSQAPTPRELPAVVRWAQLTGMLAELIEGMPRAASVAQRHAVRRGTAAAPPVGSWFVTLRQRLPARVHLSQVPVAAPAGQTPSLVQVVSVDLAHLCVLVVLPSDERASEVVERSCLPVALGGHRQVPEGTSPASPLDLARSPHPHSVAVQRLCSSSPAGHHQGG